MKSLAKIRKLTLAITLACTMTLPIQAATARDRATIREQSVRLPVTGEYTLNYTLYGDVSEEDLTWSSTNNKVATVSDGVVTALRPGTCEIRVVARQTGIADMVTILVPGTVENGEDYYGYDGKGYYYYDAQGNLRYREDSSSKTKKEKEFEEEEDDDEDIVALKGQVPQNTLVSRASTSSSVILKNYSSVSSESLKAAVNVNSKALFCFDTRLDTKVIGRLTISAATAKKLSGTIQTAVYVDCANTSKVVDRFTNYYTNRTKIVYCDQETFPVPVEISLKAPHLKSKNLYFYTYDPVNNIFHQFTAENVYKDANDYIHYTTTNGGYVVVSDGLLTAI